MEGLKKIVFFRNISLTAGPPPAPPPLGQLFVNFFFVCAKNRCFWFKNTILSPFLVGQNFHICLQSGRRGLNPPPPFYGQPDHKISVSFNDSPKHQLAKPLNVTGHSIS